MTVRSRPRRFTLVLPGQRRHARDGAARGSPGRRYADLALEFAPFGVYLVIAIAAVVRHLVDGSGFGFDALLYRNAAEAWVTGRDPWDVGIPGVQFAGAPTALFLFAPTVFVPPWLFTILAVVAAGLVSLWVVRRVGLAPYWVLYSPIAVGALLGQPTIFIVALLLTRHRWIAPLVKVIGGIPLLPLRDVRAVLLAAAAAGVTFVLAPSIWLEWFRRLPELSARLQLELGAKPDWLMIGIAAGALLVIWRLRPDHAPWLAVAALWPLPEVHYAAFALPTRNRAILLGLILVEPQLVVVAYALFLVIQRGRHAVPGGELQQLEPVPAVVHSQ